MFGRMRARLRALWRASFARGTLRTRLAIVSVAGLLVLLMVSVALALWAPGATTRQTPAALVAVPTTTSMLAPTTTTAPSPTATVHKSASKPKTPPPPAPPPPKPPPAPTGTPSGDSIFSQFCGAPTPTLPELTPTATSAPTATASATATATGTGTTTAQQRQLALASCLSCPYYAGNNPSQSQIAAALESAARLYGIPANLMKAVAWQESRWHEDVYSCDGGIGLMQIQYYTYPWLNGQAVTACGLGATHYDPYTLQGNANLGAKYLKYLSCFYSYWGNNGATASLSHPGPYTIAWYYQQAGLPYPDSYTLSGAPNPQSFCAAVFNANGYYPALPSSLHSPWPCPYTATTGDATLLDITLSAYNEGADYTDTYGIQNWWYVNGVEGWIPQFASGALPAAS
ncbi:MAG TPA: transglycosylase SLT domain-containing protein [Ktedonobacterales bacterium]|nr:transglycosylase SLT domain-containing protein [Ktedonobacterales bacterium]